MQDETSRMPAEEDERVQQGILVLLLGQDAQRPWSVAEDVAIALDHQDGGNLVRPLYGHRDKGRALDRIVGAYARRAENRPKRPGSSPRAPRTPPQERLF
jgi:hypothetical protein